MSEYLTTEYWRSLVGELVKWAIEVLPGLIIVTILLIVALKYSSF